MAKLIFWVLIAASAGSLVIQLLFGIVTPFPVVFVVLILLLVFMTIEEYYLALIWIAIWSYIMWKTGDHGGLPAAWEWLTSWLHKFREVKY